MHSMRVVAATLSACPEAGSIVHMNDTDPDSTRQRELWLQTER